MINVFPFFLFSKFCPNGITNITASKGVIAYPESGTYGINETKCWRIEVPEGYRGIYWTFSRQATLCCSFLHEPLLKHNGDILGHGRENIEPPPPSPSNCKLYWRLYLARLAVSWRRLSVLNLSTLPASFFFVLAQLFTSRTFSPASHSTDYFTIIPWVRVGDEIVDKKRGT